MGQRPRAAGDRPCARANLRARVGRATIKSADGRSLAPLGLGLEPVLGLPPAGGSTDGTVTYSPPQNQRIPPAARTLFNDFRSIFRRRIDSVAASAAVGGHRAAR